MKYYNITFPAENKTDENPASPLVSVIVPVYNSAEYLVECLNSVVNQTLRDIEILCINDGSTDGSPEILRQYQEKDSRIRLINQENRGLSCARNAGISASSGKYIYFLDSDDILKLDAMEILYNRMEEDKLELLCFDTEPFAEEDLQQKTFETYQYYKVYYKREHAYPGIYSGPGMGTALIENKEFLPMPSLSIINREHMERDHLMFYEGILHEDNLFAICNYFTAKRAAYLPEVLHFRRIRENSIMTSNASFRNVYGYLISFLESYKFLEHQTGLSVREEAAAMARLRIFLYMAKKYYKALSKEEKEKDKELSPQLLAAFRLLVKEPFDYEKSLQEQKQELQKKEQELQERKDENAYLNQKIDIHKETLKTRERELSEKIRKLEKQNESLRRENEHLKGSLGKIRKNFFYRGLRKLHIIQDR